MKKKPIKFYKVWSTLVIQTVKNNQKAWNNSYLEKNIRPMLFGLDCKNRQDAKYKLGRQIDCAFATIESANTKEDIESILDRYIKEDEKARL